MLPMKPPSILFCSFTALALSLALVLSSCEKPATTTVFECDELGWTFEYPSGWNVLSDAEIASLEGLAREPMQDAAGGEITESHENILYLRKDQFNSFTSTMQDYEEATEGPYAEAQREFFEVVLETYRIAGIETRHSFGTEVIDGLEFQTLEVEVSQTGTTEALMTQRMYDRLFSNGKTLLLSVNWNDPESQKVLQELLDSSRFLVR